MLGSSRRYFDKKLAGNDTRSSNDLRGAAGFTNDQGGLSGDDGFIDARDAPDNVSIGSNLLACFNQYQPVRIQLEWDYHIASRRAVVVYGACRR